MCILCLELRSVRCEGDVTDEKISRVCDYIVNNLEEDLSLEMLCRVAGVSKFHFHRLFLAAKGITLYRFIQLSRLKRASYILAFRTDIKIIDVAFDAGFDSPEAFTRAFKKAVGQTPSQFRKKPEWEAWNEKLIPSAHQGEVRMDIKIVDFPETKVALIEHRGSPKKVLDTAAKFIEWRKATGLSPVNKSRTFGVPYDDPNVVDEDKFRFDICGSVDKEIPQNTFGVKNGVIPGGRCAVLTHFGGHENISDSVYSMYRQWLPESGEELRDYPCFFQYVSLMPDVSECDQITEIYLPIK